MKLKDDITSSRTSFEGSPLNEHSLRMSAVFEAGNIK